METRINFTFESKASPSIPPCHTYLASFHRSFLSIAGEDEVAVRLSAKFCVIKTALRNADAQPCVSLSGGPESLSELPSLRQPFATRPSAPITSAKDWRTPPFSNIDVVLGSRSAARQRSSLKASIGGNGELSPC